MYIQAILSTVQTKLRGKLKLSLNLGICGSGMLRVAAARVARWRPRLETQTPRTKSRKVHESL